jgi:hypothetical protein
LLGINGISDRQFKVLVFRSYLINHRSDEEVFPFGCFAAIVSELLWPISTFSLEKAMIRGRNNRTLYG